MNQLLMVRAYACSQCFLWIVEFLKAFLVLGEWCVGSLGVYRTIGICSGAP